MAADEAFVDQHHAPGSRVRRDRRSHGRDADRDPQRVEVAGTDIGESRRLVARSPGPAPGRNATTCRPLSGTWVDDAAAAARRAQSGFRSVSCSWNAIFCSAGSSCGRRSANETAIVRSASNPCRPRQISKGLDEQQGGEDQHQRHRDLRDHEPALKSRPMAIDGQAARPCRMTASGSTIDTRSAGTSPNRIVVRTAVAPTNVIRRQSAMRFERDRVCRRVEERHQRPADEQRDRHGEHRAGGGDQQAFDQHLRHEPRPRRADGASHGDLAFAGAGASEHQRGEIAAGDEEHQPGQPESSDSDVPWHRAAG